MTKPPIELSTQLKMHEYEDGVKMTKISDTDTIRVAQILTAWEF